MRSRGKPPAQEIEDTRNIISQAAQQILAEEGYDGARVAEISNKKKILLGRR